MGGDIFYMVTAAEAKLLKKEPQKIWEYDRNQVRHVDLGLYGYHIDAALEYARDEVDDDALSLAVHGGKEIGGPEVAIKTLSSKDVAAVSSALDKIDKEMLGNALCNAFGTCNDIETDCYSSFQALADFYKDAAAKRKTVVKTIY